MKLEIEVAQNYSALARGSSILAETSKIFNLVLSGIMAATAWTLMNQSKEIATLSRQMIENCTMPSGTLNRWRICSLGSSHVPELFEATGVNEEDPEIEYQESREVCG